MSASVTLLSEGVVPDSIYIAFRDCGIVFWLRETMPLLIG